jgi:hypothetical protein
MNRIIDAQIETGTLYFPYKDRKTRMCRCTKTHKDTGTTFFVTVWRTSDVHGDSS